VQLTALVESPDHVCCRYRLRALEPILARAGHSLRFVSLPRRWWQCWEWVQNLTGASVILQRRVLPNWQRPWLRRLVKNLIFDFDDAVFLRDSYHRRGIQDPPRLMRFAGLMRHSDLIVAGNSYLAEHAGRWTDPAKVSVVPTCVDPRRYPLASHRRVWPKVQLVWVGSSSTLQGLERIQPLLETIGQACPHVSLKLVCDRFLKLKHLPTVPVGWTEDGEANEIATSDIGFAWVPDDSWSRGKCGLKVLQYLAAGLPVVANPVGVHVEMVQHGVTGFLAETTREWIEAIATLAANPDLRRKMGQAGRRLVETRYSVEVGAKRWLTLLARLEARSVREREAA